MNSIEKIVALLLAGDRVQWIASSAYTGMFVPHQVTSLLNIKEGRDRFHVIGNRIAERDGGVVFSWTVDKDAPLPEGAIRMEEEREFLQEPH